ncbi:MAG: branched-chain amino acid ABC transporter permease [Chloroflexi bacterium]|nr:MAG: branched-chain amino acid ABC transporter permease [Chloroflexota bacterium]
MLVNAILGLSIYVTLYTGMFSLANAGFMAIGAYSGVLITQNLDMPLFVGIIGGMLAAGIVAVPIGLPVLRLKDIYLAIATIGFGEVVRIFALNFDELASSIKGEDVQLFYGAQGIKRIPKITETWHLVLAIALIGYFLVRINRSRFGRAMAAIRQDEEAAANMGIDVVRIKNIIFIISAMIAGLAGVMNAHLTRIITPGDFGFDRAVNILAFAVLGGTTTWVGPIVGGLVLGGLPEVLRVLRDFRQIVNGAVLLAVIIFLPGGLINPAGWAAALRNVRGGDDEALLIGGGKQNEAS